jgi:hypothetical protein
MLRISQLKLPISHTQEELEQKIRRELRLSKDTPFQYEIQKQSIDARKKPELFYVYTVDFTCKDEARIEKQCKQKVTRVKQAGYQIPKYANRCDNNEAKSQEAPRIIVVGSGPAGLFCAYVLAKAGLPPILIERGAPVEERIQDVEAFWKTGVLNPLSNVQFGEGGAGTFSDGKLNTLVKDPMGRNRFVLETFVECGAPKEILYQQKPHIGTDLLIEVVKTMRHKMQEMGVEIHFHTQLTDFQWKQEGDTRRICALQYNHKEWVAADAVVLAIGHSARDTFSMLYERDVCMQAKSFAVGVRIEHPQTMINKSQYGMEEHPHLPVASYKLTTQLENGRGVYTFCMCPGGYVVNASSEEGRLAVNGMSYHDRAGENANSAIIVTVTPEDFASNHPLAGVAFQRELEERAYKVGEGKIPVQRFEDYQLGRPTKEAGAVRPQLKGAYKYANVREVFPEVLATSIEEGICKMNQKIQGFSSADALLSAVESRTSSPVRMERDEQFQSNLRGIYPCGEGAGYAGGITSAAMDGVKVAEAILFGYNS